MFTIFDGKPAEKPRKYSITSNVEPEEVEKITFPPSTELIQDEYKHEDNKLGLVYIFYSTADKQSMELLKEALSDQEYEVPSENTIEITTRAAVLDAFQRSKLNDYYSRLSVFCSFYLLIHCVIHILVAIEINKFKLQYILCTYR